MYFLCRCLVVQIKVWAHNIEVLCLQNTHTQFTVNFFFHTYFSLLYLLIQPRSSLIFVETMFPCRSFLLFTVESPFINFLTRFSTCLLWNHWIYHSEKMWCSGFPPSLHLNYEKKKKKNRWNVHSQMFCLVPIIKSFVKAYLLYIIKMIIYLFLFFIFCIIFLGS